MADLSFELKLNDNVKLGKLYKDASEIKNLGNVESETGSMQNAVNNTNKYGGVSSSKVETMNFDPALDESRKYQNSINNNLNETTKSNTNSNSINENISAKQSTMMDSNSHNVSQNPNSNNINSNQNNTSQNSDFSSNIDSQFYGNDISKQSRKYTENDKLNFNSQNNNKQNASSNNINFNNFNSNNNDSNLSSTNVSNGSLPSKTYENSSNVASPNAKIINDKAIYTSIDSTGTTFTTEISLVEYTEILKNHGLNDRDIARVTNNEISLEELMIEIEDDKDSSRKYNVMASSYLNASGIGISSLTDLDKEIEKLEKKQSVIQQSKDSSNVEKEFNEVSTKLQNYKYLKEVINNNITYYLNKIEPYISQDDFYNNCNFPSQCMDTIKNIRGINDQTVIDVLACIVNGKGHLEDGMIFVTEDKKTKIKLLSEIVQNYNAWASNMSTEEVNIFNYIYNTKGSKAAYEYLLDMAEELDSRWLETQKDKDQKYATEHSFISSLKSIYITPIEGMSAAVYSLNSVLTDTKIKRMNVHSSGDIWRATVAQNIAQDYGAGWSFAYGITMSIADTAILMATGAASGGAALISTTLSATLMGSRAYVSTLNDALDRGINDSIAVLLGATAGIIETAMESYSLGHLIHLEEKLGKQAINITKKIANKISNENLAYIASRTAYIAASALNQGLAEGEEEFATEILNYFTDNLISGELSSHTLAINNYIQLGFTEEEARNYANKDFYNQLFQAFLGGFVSGIIFGSFSGSMTTHRTSKNISKQMLTDLNLNKAQEFANQVRTLNYIIDSEKYKEIFNSMSPNQKGYIDVSTDLKGDVEALEWVLRNSNTDLAKRINIYSFDTSTFTKDIVAFYSKELYSQYRNLVELKIEDSEIFDSTEKKELIDKIKKLNHDIEPNYESTPTKIEDYKYALKFGLYKNSKEKIEVPVELKNDINALLWVLKARGRYDILGNNAREVDLTSFDRSLFSEKLIEHYPGLLNLFKKYDAANYGIYGVKKGKVELPNNLVNSKDFLKWILKNYDNHYVLSDIDLTDFSADLFDEELLSEYGDELLKYFEEKYEEYGEIKLPDNLFDKEFLLNLVLRKRKDNNFARKIDLIKFSESLFTEELTRKYSDEILNYLNNDCGRDENGKIIIPDNWLENQAILELILEKNIHNADLSLFDTKLLKKYSNEILNYFNNDCGRDKNGKIIIPDNWLKSQSILEFALQNNLEVELYRFAQNLFVKKATDSQSLFERYSEKFLEYLQRLNDDLYSKDDAPINYIPWKNKDFIEFILKKRIEGNLIAKKIDLCRFDMSLILDIASDKEEYTNEICYYLNKHLNVLENEEIFEMILSASGENKRIADKIDLLSLYPSGENMKIFTKYTNQILENLSIHHNKNGMITIPENWNNSPELFEIILSASGKNKIIADKIDLLSFYPSKENKEIITKYTNRIFESLNICYNENGMITIPRYWGGIPELLEMILSASGENKKIADKIDLLSFYPLDKSREIITKYANRIFESLSICYNENGVITIPRYWGGIPELLEMILSASGENKKIADKIDFLSFYPSEENMKIITKYANRMFKDLSIYHSKNDMITIPEYWQRSLELLEMILSASGENKKIADKIDLLSFYPSKENSKIITKYANRIFESLSICYNENGVITIPGEWNKSPELLEIILSASGENKKIADKIDLLSFYPSEENMKIITKYANRMFKDLRIYHSKNDMITIPEYWKKSSGLLEMILSASEENKKIADMIDILTFNSEIFTLDFLTAKDGKNGKAILERFKCLEGNVKYEIPTSLTHKGDFLWFLINSVTDEILVEFDEKKIIINEKTRQKINEILKFNDEAFNTLDIRFLSDKFDVLDNNWYLTFILYPELQEQIINMNSNFFEIFVKMIDIITKETKVDATDLIYNIIMNYDNNNYNELYNNISNIKDVSKLSDAQVKNLMYIFGRPDNFYNINDLSELEPNKFNQKKQEALSSLENRFQSNDVTLEECRIYLLQKWFGITMDTAIAIKKVYLVYPNEVFAELQSMIDNSSPISEDIDKTLKILKEINFILTTEDINIIKLIDKLCGERFAIYEKYSFMTLESYIRSVYAKMYSETLYTPNIADLVKKDNLAFLQNYKYNEEVPTIYVPQNDFYMMTHALGAYSDFKNELNTFKTYVNTWNRSKMASHGVCTATINEEFLITAAPRNPIYGFKEISSSILAAGPYDLGSVNTKFDIFNSLRSALLPPKLMIEKTQHTHNEIVFERFKKTSNGLFITNEELGPIDIKVQPDYIIYLTDSMQETSFNNALYKESVRAAVEHNIPLVIIDRSHYLAQQKSKSQELLNAFQDNPNYLNLRKLITNYTRNIIAATYNPNGNFTRENFIKLISEEIYPQIKNNSKLVKDLIDILNGESQLRGAQIVNDLGITADIQEISADFIYNKLSIAEVADRLQKGFYNALHHETQKTTSSNITESFINYRQLESILLGQPIEENSQLSSSAIKYIKNGDEERIILFEENASHRLTELAVPQTLQEIQLFETMANKYIPIYSNKTGEMLFSQEEFNNLRRKMSGLITLNGGNFVFAENLNLPEYPSENLIKFRKDGKIPSSVSFEFLLDSVETNIKSCQEDSKNVIKFITDKLLNGLNVPFELIETGSTARGANVISGSDTISSDFDFVLKIDKEYLPAIKNQITSNLTKISHRVPELLSRDYRIRIFGIEQAKGIPIEGFNDPIDIDITFCTDTTDYLSTDGALTERLEQIKSQNSENYKKVLANIIYAKSFLKQIGAYKPSRSLKSIGQESMGGLGGVGIENWILQNGGSFISAAKEFLSYAEKAEKLAPNNTFQEFIEFEKMYAVHDFGKNHVAVSKKAFPYDNFIMNNMRYEGYQTMKNALRDFIAFVESDPFYSIIK